MRAVFRLDECSGSNPEAAMKNGEFATPEPTRKTSPSIPFTTSLNTLDQGSAALAHPQAQ
jgi:hypothetical protein